MCISYLLIFLALRNFSNILGKTDLVFLSCFCFCAILNDCLEVRFGSRFLLKEFLFFTFNSILAIYWFFREGFNTFVKNINSYFIKLTFMYPFHDLFFVCFTQSVQKYKSKNLGQLCNEGEIHETKYSRMDQVKCVEGSF